MSLFYSACLLISCFHCTVSHIVIKCTYYWLPLFLLVLFPQVNMFNAPTRPSAKASPIISWLSEGCSLLDSSKAGRFPEFPYGPYCLWSSDLDRKSLGHSFFPFIVKHYSICIKCCYQKV